MLFSVLNVTAIAMTAFNMTTMEPYGADGPGPTYEPPVYYVAENHYTYGGTDVRLLIGGFFPLTSSNVSGMGIAAKVAADLAIEDINFSSHTLPGYTLSMQPQDTECKASVGTKAFFDLMNTNDTSPDRILILLGDACTEVNEPVALAAKQFHVVQVSYGETHPKFSSEDKDSKYPMFYRLVPSQKNLRFARLQFLRYFNWSHLATVVLSDDPRFSLVHQPFTGAYLSVPGARIVETRDFSSNSPDLANNLQSLKDRDARIFMVYVNDKLAAQLFCEIYRARMYGPQYVWLLPGYQDDHWWESVVEFNENCTEDQFFAAMNGHFIFEFVAIRKDRVATVNHHPARVFEERFMKACALTNGCDNKTHFNGFAYDGVWTVAKALDRVVRLSKFHDKSKGVLQPLSVPGVNVSVWGDLLIGALNNLSFQGVTGKVRFENNERFGLIRIAQFQNRSYVTVGSYDGADGDFSLLDEKIYWPDGQPPIDARMQLTLRRYVNFTLFCVMTAFTAVGIVLALLFLGVNIVFREHRFIKMSSPNMNNLIIMGSVLIYISVILMGIDTRVLSDQGFEANCAAKIWVFSFGFTLAFGSLFSKTWRVHSIFTNIKLNKKAIKDYQLFLIVGVLLLVDGFILVIWIVVDPFFMSVKELTSDVELCGSHYSVVFNSVMLGYKGLLLVLGCFLAWETRHVNVPALNDSKYIGMSVYNVVLMCVVGVALSFILQDRINESFALLSIFIIFCTTLTLCLVFVPKIVELVRNPKGNEKRYKTTMMKSHSPKDSARGASQGSIETDFYENFTRAQQDNEVWKKLLDDRDRDTEETIKQLHDLGEDPPLSFLDVSVNMKDSAIDTITTISSREASDANLYGGVFLGDASKLARAAGHTVTHKATITGAPIRSTSIDIGVTALPCEFSPPITEKTSLLADRQTSVRKNTAMRLRDGKDSCRPDSMYYSAQDLDESMPLHSLPPFDSHVPNALPSIEDSSYANASGPRYHRRAAALVNYSSGQRQETVLYAYWRQFLKRISWPHSISVFPSLLPRFSANNKESSFSDVSFYTTEGSPLRNVRPSKSLSGMVLQNPMAENKLREEQNFGVTSLNYGTFPSVHFDDKPAKVMNETPQKQVSNTSGKPGNGHLPSTRASLSVTAHPRREPIHKPRFAPQWFHLPDFGFESDSVSSDSNHEPNPFLFATVDYQRFLQFLDTNEESLV